MLESLRLIIEENWQWRRQIWNLALFDLKKQCRGTALGWVWLLVKPAMYIAVFWFALDLGLRAGDSTGDYPYILWLASGLIPWFFMQSMLNSGSNVFKRYPYLVNRIRFPLSSISSFYTLSQFLVSLLLISILVAVCAVTGHLSVYALQLIPVYFVMFFFFTCFSIMTSPLSAISKDFYNMIKTFSTPIFWVSGIIFNVSNLPIPLLHAVLAFNPVTFFATACRASLCENYWIWERPELLLPFLAVLLVTVFCTVLCYARLRKDVADVL